MEVIMEILYRDFPDLVHVTGSEADIQMFIEALKAARERVRLALIGRLINSMPDRIARLRRVPGRYPHC